MTALDLTGVGDATVATEVGAFTAIDDDGDLVEISNVKIGDFYNGGAGTSDSSVLYLDNAQAGEAYTIFTNVTAGQLNINSTSLVAGDGVGNTDAYTKMGDQWVDENLISSNGLLTGKWSVVDHDGVGVGTGIDLVLTMERNGTAVRDVFTSMSNGMASLVDELYTLGENANALDNVDANGYTTNAGIAFVSRVTSGTYMPDRREAAATLEGAAQIAVAGGVPYITSNVISKVSNLIIDHNDLLNATQPAYGNEPGQFGLWVTPFYSMGDVDGMDAGRFENGFDINYGGAAFGMDYNITESFRLGLALNLGSGDTDTDESGSDFNQTENDFDFFGGTLYGSYTNGAFGLTGDLGYTSVDNDIEQRVPASLGLGSRLHSDVDSDAFTVGLTGKYRFAAGENLNIAPHLGLRYTKIGIDNTTVRMNGNGRVFDADTEDMNLFQIPLGVEFTGNIVTDGGWTLTPKADLGVLFTTGDTDVDTHARIAGTSINTGTMNADVIDSAAFTGTLGIKAANDSGMSLGLDYGILASGNQTDHQFTGMLRFEF
jgi:hypothetical protein